MLITEGRGHNAYLQFLALRLWPRLLAGEGAAQASLQIGDVTASMSLPVDMGSATAFESRP